MASRIAHAYRSIPPEGAKAAPNGQGRGDTEEADIEEIRAGDALDAALGDRPGEVRLRRKAYLAWAAPLRIDGIPRAAFDLRAGAGDWMELAARLGFDMSGADTDEGALARLRARGESVAQASPLAALAGQGASSLALVTGFGVVEGLAPDQLEALFAEAMRVLAPGGMLVLEAPNPENARTLALMQAHVAEVLRAVPADRFAALAQSVGFARHAVHGMHERPDVSGGAIQLRDVAAEVSPALAVVCQKPGSETVLAATSLPFTSARGLHARDLADRFEQKMATRAEVVDLSLELQRVGHHLQTLNDRLAAETGEIGARTGRLEGQVAELWEGQGALRMQLAKLAAKSFSGRIDRRLRKILGDRSEPSRASADRDGAPKPSGPLAPEPPTPTGDAPVASSAERPAQPTTMTLQTARPAFGQTLRKGAQALRWRVEGPFDSSYSLAVVNRDFVRGLARQGVEVGLVSAEGPGPFDPDPAFLSANPDLSEMVARAKAWDAAPERPAHDIVSRFMYPPRVHDIGPRPAAVHCYGWEETAFPDDWAEAFNTHLDLLTTMSEHVRKVMIDNGVALPIHNVGLGVDHLQGAAPEPLPPDALPEAALSGGVVPGGLFLHVSSCFPRKGADVLLRAWARAFTAEDGVALVIKTFENPHNQIAAQLDALRAEHPGLAPVHLVFGDWTDGQVRALYQAADVVVLPSRAEGFCLPVAEAALEGCRVIVTGWSGPVDFAGCPLVEFAGYRYGAASTHHAQGDSVWAEPDLDDLVHRMQAAVSAGPASPADRAAARNWLLPKFSIAEVGRRGVEAAEAALATPIAHPRIGWVSTFNARCGIATYSAHLIAHLGLPVHVLAAQTRSPVAPDETLGVPLSRCWRDDALDPLNDLADEIARRDLQMLVIQFNYAFFDTESLGGLIRRLKAEGRQVVVMMHGTDDARAPHDRQIGDIRADLALCDRLVVHTTADLERLRALGLDAAAMLFPHGILSAPEMPQPEPSDGRSITIGSYGFLFPNKGIPELIEAVTTLRRRGRPVDLAMYHAQYPSEASHLLREHCMRLILRNTMAPYIRLDTRFRPDEEVLGDLGRCDLLVYPYQHSAESASGAVRFGLASGRPVAVTPLALFSDVAPCVLPLPGASPSDLAEGIDAIVSRLLAGERFDDVRARARAECDRLAYTRLGPRLGNMLIALHVNR